MFPRNFIALSLSGLKTVGILQVQVREFAYGKNYRKLMIPLSKSPPKQHMRRLLEAAGEPILPTDPKVLEQTPANIRCKRPKMEMEERRKMIEFTPREIAYRDHLRKHLMEATAVILCHEHPTDTRLQHYDLMDMSANGIAMARQQNAKVVRSVLEGSSLEPFAVFFDDDDQMLTSLLYTKRYLTEEDDGRSDVISGRIRDRNYLPLAMRYAKKTPWLVPMAVVYEDRMLTVAEAEQVVSMMTNPLQVRAETVALLNRPMTETGRLLGDHSSSLSAALESRVEQLKSQGQEAKSSTAES